MKFDLVVREKGDKTGISYHVRANRVLGVMRHNTDIRSDMRYDLLVGDGTIEISGVGAVV